ncbi:MAG TPA: MFS transporter [Turneriella sp.]|nr:MFS transporter [Turneriella sp.]HNL09476.1 MFS transporter [Turneriella sp.]HNL53277.1 MFS transporter [Turneriella sp.]
MRFLPLSLYALAESGIFAVEFFVRLQLLIFYTDRLGVESYLASLAAGLALVWDAFIDPYVGAFSDRFRSRWGNRKPFLVAGALLIVPSLLWIFAPYREAGAIGIFVQLLLASLLLNTGITLVTVPHAAISAELSKDAGVRVRIFAARLLFANLGLILGLIIPAAMLNNARAVGIAETTVFPQIATVIGLFSLAAVLVCVASLQNTQPGEPGHKRRFVSDLKTAVGNKFFLWLFAAGFLAYIGVAINSTLARYYYDHYLKINEDSLALVLIVFILVWSLSVVLWVKAADRFGKDLPATLGIVGLGLMTIFSYPFFPEGGLTGPIVAAVAGGIFTGCILLFDSYVADAADLDLAQSGENRDGLYFGLWKLGIKASRGVAVALSGGLIWAIGYRAGVTPDDVVRFRIALLFGPLVGSIFVASGLVFYFKAARARSTSSR